MTCTFKLSYSLKAIAASCAAILASFCTAQTRPNILIIVTDDQGYGELAAHGHPFLQTPNMDRLYHEGVRLADYHVTPMCTPTRGALLTGIDPLRNRASFIAGQRMAMREDLPTIGDLFQDAGYATGLFGKWHLGGVYPHRAMDQGFSETVTFAGPHIGSLSDYWLNDYFDDHYQVNGVETQFKGYVQEVLTEETINFMEQSHANGKQFLSIMMTPLPHIPYYATKEKRKRFETMENLSSDEKGHFAMLEEVDASIGTMLDFLDSSGLADNTIVIFMSDNGGTIGVPTYNAGMRGYKTTYYEGGHRSPGFIRWPERFTSPGLEIHGISYVTDILPTLLDLANIDYSPEQYDGISLKQNLINGTPIDPNRIISIQYGAFTTSPMGKEKKDERVILYRNWRLLNSWNPGNESDQQELYDIAKDPAQKRNVIAQHPEIVKKMQDHYDLWWDELQPNFEQWVRYNVGSQAVPSIRLSLQEAAGINRAHQKGVREGQRTTGRWKLMVMESGTYRVRLMRYPEEADLAINAAAPAYRAKDYHADSRNADDFIEGRGLMANRVKFSASNGKVYITEVPPGAKYVDIKTFLDSGELDIWDAVFMNPQGKVASAVYYLEIEKIAEKTL